MANIKGFLQNQTELPESGKIGSALCFSLFLVCGLGIIFYSAAARNFNFLPGDFHDGSLNHYILEYTWQWLSGGVKTASIWDPPMFYPHGNALAFTDSALGWAWLYWILRFLGVSEFHAFLAMPFILASLNFWAMHLFLRKSLDMDNMAACIGAYLFAFCAPCLLKILQIQLWVQFYAPLALACLIFFWRFYAAKPLKAHLALFACAILLALQLYSSWYIFWFLGFGGGILFLMALCVKKCRDEVLALIKSQWAWLLATFMLCAVLFYPFIDHYYFGAMKMDQFQLRYIHDWWPPADYLIRTQSFIYKHIFSQELKYIWEKAWGIGIATFLIASYGLYKFSLVNIWIRLSCFSLLLLYFLTVLPFGDGYVWDGIFTFVPGAGAIRYLGRIFLYFIIFLCIGLAWAANIQRKFNYKIIIIIALLILENMDIVRFERDNSREAAIISPIAAATEKHRLPFVYISNAPGDTIKRNQDAMWASLRSRVPTYNGRSSIGYAENFALVDLKPGNLPDSPFLKKISGPYLLLAHLDGKFYEAVIKSQADLQKFSSELAKAK